MPSATEPPASRRYFPGIATKTPMARPLLPSAQTIGRLVALACVACGLAEFARMSPAARGEPPGTSYVFPAGAQRGTQVKVRIGGYYLHERSNFELLGSGVTAPAEIQRVPTLWFEGPLVRLPASQRSEDYPRDYEAELAIAADAPLGPRLWRAWNGQGGTPARRFIVGDLPEVVEQEIDGEPIPTPVKPPVTINGRVFPREDVDIWTFEPPLDRVTTCAVEAGSFGSPLEARIEVRDPAGTVIAEATGRPGAEPLIQFTARTAGPHELHIHDVRGEGLQSFVYRVTVTDGPWVQSAVPLGVLAASTANWQLEGANLLGSNAAVANRTAAVEAEAPRFPTDVVAAGAGSSPSHASLVSSRAVAMRWQMGDRLTNPVTIMLDPPATRDGFQEFRETEPNDDQPLAFTGPAMLHGRIDHLADRDTWSVAMTKGVEWTVETQAARLGSQLIGVLVVSDATGREVARAVSDTNTPDPIVRFTPAADGVFTITLADRFAPSAPSAPMPANAETGSLQAKSAVVAAEDRGATTALTRAMANVAPRPYRLRIAPTQPGFQLEVANDQLNVERGATGKLTVQVNREGGFKEPVTLSVEGLPEGVEVAELIVAPNQNRGELIVKPSATALIGPSRLRVVGRSTVNGQAVAVSARILAQGLPGHAPNPPAPTAGSIRGVDMGPDHVWLCIALPTPFKFQGVYEMTYIPCGAVSRKSYVLQRNGYEGPLQVELADRQARHLQGVTGPTITIPAGVSEFTYPISLPPWMELGRTSRVVLMATGEVDDGSGRRHKVTFTSGDQNNQMVNLVSPSPLRIALDRGTAAATAGKTTPVVVRIRRDRALQAAVRLEIVPPPHLRGVSAAPVIVPANQEAGELALAFGESPGPFTAPLLIRATAERAGDPLVAEASLELVPVP